MQQQQQQQHLQCGQQSIPVSPACVCTRARVCVHLSLFLPYLFIHPSFSPSLCLPALLPSLHLGGYLPGAHLACYCWASVPDCNPKLTLA